MIAEKHIRHYNALQGNKISRKGLLRFHAALKKDIDSGRIDAHVPYGVELLEIEKRVANALKKINGHVMRVELKPIKIRPFDALKVRKAVKKKVEASIKKADEKKVVAETPKSERENKKTPRPPVERKERSKATAEISKKLGSTNDLNSQAKAIIEKSAYTVDEIKSEYKNNQSESWRHGFFSARGFNWLQGQIIEQGILNRKSKIVKRKSSKKLSGVVDASALAGISYSTFDLAPEWKKEFHKINSDSVLMIWGKPGSGKTVKLLKLAQHLSMDLKKKVLYIAEEEYGRSTLADKLTEHKIGNANLSFAPDLTEGILSNFDAIFLDSVNSMHLSPADVKNLIRKYPGKLWVLIVQTTKEGDFRGGRDWEHLVDIAGEVVNRKMILRKNRLDPNNKAKADKLLVQELVAEKKQNEKIKQLVKGAEQTEKTVEAIKP